MDKKNLSCFVSGKKIRILNINGQDYLCLSNIVDHNKQIRNWIRNKKTVEFLSAWELAHNSNFKKLVVDRRKLTPKLCKYNR